MLIPFRYDQCRTRSNVEESCTSSNFEVLLYVLTLTVTRENANISLENMSLGTKINAVRTDLI